MAKSGITRRIDELGRIVVPKEIRYNLGIRDGEPLEIYIENKSIVIKKYSQVENIKDISQKLTEIIGDVCNVEILISDREKILAATKKIKSLLNFKLEEKYKRLIDNREQHISTQKEEFYNINTFLNIVPIITSTDCTGLIFILNNENNPENIKYARIIQKLLVEKLDIV